MKYNWECWKSQTKFIKNFIYKKKIKLIKKKNIEQLT